MSSWSLCVNVLLLHTTYPYDTNNHLGSDLLNKESAVIEFDIPD